MALATVIIPYRATPVRATQAPPPLTVSLLLLLPAARAPTQHPSPHFNHTHSQSAPISTDSKESRGRVVEEEGNDADLQDALDDLDLIELEDHTVGRESVKPPIREATHGGAATSSSGLVVGRCDPTVLGGSTIPMGQGSRSDSKACNMYGSTLTLCTMHSRVPFLWWPQWSSREPQSHTLSATHYNTRTRHF